ncbi:tyrosine-protein kinase SYK-like [Lineus longissimus]|uniref:tyrosine-protein kinase SYK-like n=1 Tax=Lineus longissimus TaxID=88925 RepID=UPI002B4CB63D
MSPSGPGQNVANAIIPGSVRYYWGRIPREDAERILRMKGNGLTEGMFLLRESSSKFGNFAVSLCHDNRVHHYSIERDSDGMVWIPGGKKFIGPVELVRYHSEFIAGFLTRPSAPCNRGPGEIPMVFKGVPMYEMEQKVIELMKSRRIKGQDLEYALGRDRAKYLSEVAKQLHLGQPWYHGVIDRPEAERRLTAGTGHKNGKFLVRQRGEKSYALTLSYEGQCVHYLIDLSKHGHYTIENGTKFNSLMEMIDVFHSRLEGLRCKLKCACYRPDFQAGGAAAVSGIWQDMTTYREVCNRSIPGANLKPAPEIVPNKHPVTRPVMDHVDGESIWDEPDLPDVPPDTPPAVPTAPRPNRVNEYDPYDKKIYDVVPRDNEMMNLPRKHLDLKEPLGSGQFGDVLKGFYLRKGKNIPVAVKTLKSDTAHQGEGELMKEAKLMQGMEHKHIVRMIGVCKAEMIMLVMELAPLGQLNKYLKKHPEAPHVNLIDLLHQISMGMKYLEGVGFVHRDLAARNVLLVDPLFAKISDFGMSKALNIGNDYYRATNVGKWPLKWYAPECIYYYKFDSRSDVWSYGVTMWETFSYGGKPYRGMKGTAILGMIEEGERLLKPDRCPDNVYDVMRKCWTYKREERPNFTQIEKLMADLLKSMRKGQNNQGGAWGGR